MSKLNMHTPDLTAANVAKIASLFPNCVTESRDDTGTLRTSVDFDLLRQELNGSIVEGPVERYTLNWPGKREAIVAANTPVYKTLRPCVEESVNFDTTQNLYIEGDNLEVLKLLQETYLGKVKMIYIDPPYNTGNDFIYDDDFSADVETDLLKSSQKDESGGRLVANTESNGRFHSDWLSMMYPRLKLARDLLREDGVIFISIDDSENHNLKEICDVVFGEKNFVAQVVKIGNSAKNNVKQLSITHEYCLIYAKNLYSLPDWHVTRTNSEEFQRRANALLNCGLSDLEIQKELRLLVKYPRFYDFDHYTYVDVKGVFRANDLTAPNSKNFFDIIHPVTKKPCKLGTRGWAYSPNEINELMAKNLLYFGETETVIPQLKCYLSETLTQAPRGVMFYDSQSDTKWIKSNKLGFDFPKPLEYLKRLISMSTDSLEGYIILDFFSGSATTAHAVMQLNADDGGNRRFIMVQVPEVCDEKSEAFKAGYKNICEIGKERIRRAGKKIKEENATNAPNLDVGFRVFKVDSSNMKDVYYTPDALEQDQLDLFADAIKEDRTAEDLLFQVFLDCGLDLSLPVAKETVEGHVVYTVDGNAMVACFTSDVSEPLIRALAKRQPLRAVFLDRSFGKDSTKLNVTQIFKQLSPNTDVKTL